MIQGNYGIRIKPNSSRNSQTNFILERVHQAIGYIICIFKVKHMVLDNENPWDRILASTMFELRAIVHITTQHTPSQLVFGRDSILNSYHKAKYQCKQDLLIKENSKKF